MSQLLKKTVKRAILEYRAYIRRQNIREFATRRYAPSTVLTERKQAQNLVDKVNTKMNLIIDDLNAKSRRTALEILDGDEGLMRRFSQSDKFDQTFSQRFKMAHKRLRKVLRRSIFDSYDKGLTVKQTLDEAQKAWENSHEFTKFIAYMTADAFNFNEINKIGEHSTTGYFEIYLSEAHEHTDICNLHVGIYEIGEDVELPPYHPYCVCGVRGVNEQPNLKSIKKPIPKRPKKQAKKAA